MEKRYFHEYDTRVISSDFTRLMICGTRIHSERAGSEQYVSLSVPGTNILHAFHPEKWTGGFGPDMTAEGRKVEEVHPCHIHSSGHARFDDRSAYHNVPVAPATRKSALFLLEENKLPPQKTHRYRHHNGDLPVGDPEN